MKTCSKCNEPKSESEFRKDKQKRDGLYSSCRACVASAFQIHYEKNADDRRRLSREWSANNRERKKATRAAYYAANSKRMNMQNAEYRSKNRERCVAVAIEWARKNPEKRRAISTRSVHKRRAEKAMATIGDLDLIASWGKSWRGKASVKCYWCRGSFQPSECHQDHVAALSNGGAHEIGNLCISCSACNVRKSARNLSDWNRRIAEPVLL